MPVTTPLLYRAGLLAGLGGALSASLAAQASTLPNKGLATQAPNANCVNGASASLLTVSAPGPRALRLLALATVAPGEQGPQSWAMWQGARAVGQVCFDARSQGLALGHFPKPSGTAHEALAREGHLYRVDQAFQPTDAMETATWYAYQLGRHADPAQVMAGIDCSQAWQRTEAVWAQLLGRPLPRRSRPWSISLPTQTREPVQRVRTASSLWALLPETEQKYTRLAHTIDALGGDGRFAEALYKLLAQANPGPHPAIVGAAVEITCAADGSDLQLDCVLRCPNEPPSTQGSPMPEEDRSHWNKIDSQTTIALKSLNQGDNPVVAASVTWASTPSAEDMALIQASGGVWQSGGGATANPTSIQTLRLPLRAIESLARMPSVMRISAGQPMGLDGAANEPPQPLQPPSTAQ